MIKHGVAPFLECSGEGYKPFSALYARIRCKEHRTIEFIYQTSKIIGGAHVTVIGAGVGQKADNQEECNRLYSELWNMYIAENPHYIALLRQQTGLSDVFGKKGHCCQATELWRIRNDPNFAT